MRIPSNFLVKLFSPYNGGHLRVLGLAAMECNVASLKDIINTVKLYREAWESVACTWQTSDHNRTIFSIDP